MGKRPIDERIESWHSKDHKAARVEAAEADRKVEAVVVVRRAIPADRAPLATNRAGVESIPVRNN
jgi:hypothetical protein